MEIAIDDPRRADVLVLLEEHLADMHATCPAESVHALGPDALAQPEITFWTARDVDGLLGCAALKQLSPTHVELKSMRTAATARRRGVAGRLLDHLLGEARTRGFTRVSLETGTEDYFEPARRFYRSHGFQECGPFEGYGPDPNTIFLTRVP